MLRIAVLGLSLIVISFNSRRMTGSGSGASHG
jgi:hypothetical protein